MLIASRSSKVYLEETIANKMEECMNTRVHVKYSVVGATAALTEAESLTCNAVGKA